MQEMKLNKRRETGYIKSMTQEEFDTIVNALKPYEHNYRLIFFLMFYMGLRIGECVTLRHSDILGNYKKLRVRLHKQKKIIERLIPKIVAEELERYVFIERFSTTGNLFEPKRKSGSKNPHLQGSSVRWKVKKLREKTGLDDYYFVTKAGKKLARISPHTMRHAFLTRFYEKSGHDLLLTQRIIGHERADTTARYINTDKEKEEEVINLL